MKVGKFIIPLYFVVLGMDLSLPIILDRPFVANIGTIIDVNYGKLNWE